MPRKKSTSDTIVEQSMREVFDNPPGTLKPGQSAEARRKQQVAIGLEKARSKGADIPDKPAKKRGSKARY